MKKIISIILAFALFAFILCLVGCSNNSMDHIIKTKPNVTGIVQEVHDNYIIMYSDSAKGYPNGSRWQISLNVENKDSYTTLAVGDEIIVYHNGQVMETEPLKVGKVFAITLKTPADRTKNEGDSAPEDVQSVGIPVHEAFDITVSYANWGDLNEIYAKALNSDKMVISSVRHLPIYKFDTLVELEQFKTDIDGILSIDHGYDEIPSFNEATAKYDKKFFIENTLMLVYVEASSGSYRYGVDSVYHADGNFCIHIKQTNNPEVCTDDMAGWFITVAVPDSMVADCSVFDADFNIANYTSTEYMKENNLLRVYSYKESDNIFKPSITLFEDNKFQFTFSVVSSYLGIGTYTIKDNFLVLNTSDGNYTYTFKIEGENMDRLIFLADKSSENIHMGKFEDGAVFEGKIAFPINLDWEV